MFYSRPNLPQLAIDLIEFEEDGPLMATFSGRAADGRPISARYRNGRLTINAGSPGARFGRTPDVLLEAQIGSMLHRDILKEQVCDLVGMTIRGQRPLLSDEALQEAMETEDFWDWSGRTTYWVRHVFASEAGSHKLTAELKAAFPSMQILETTFESSKRRFALRDSLAGIQGGAIFGFEADEMLLARMREADHVKLAELDQAFTHRLVFRFTWNDRVRVDRSYTDRLAAKYGSHVKLHPLGHLSGLGYLRARFATDDPEGRVYIEKLIRTVESCFSNWFEDVDLTSGNTIGVRTISNWYSNDIRDWCAAAPNRYFFGRVNVDDSGCDIGTRPCFPPT